MRLEVSLLTGPETKQFLVELTKQLDRMEKLQGKPEQEETEDDDDNEFAEAPKSKRGRPKKEAESFEEEEEVEIEEISSFEDEQEEETPKKKALSLKDVNDACAARALRSTKAEVLGILKKKFKVSGIKELSEDQYAAVVKAMK